MMKQNNDCRLQRKAREVFKHEDSNLAFLIPWKNHVSEFWHFSWLVGMRFSHMSHSAVGNPTTIPVYFALVVVFLDLVI